VTFRCTERVRKRFKLTAVASADASTNVLGDWYANLLNHGPERHVVLVSERTLLPLIVPARKADFPDKVGDQLAEVLRSFGVPTRQIEAEVAKMRAYRIGRTQNRQVLSVLNEFCLLATYHMPEESPILASLRLSETPLGPFGGEAADQRTCDAFGIPRQRNWWWSDLRVGPHAS